MRFVDTYRFALADNAEFESKHKRDKNGQFAKTASGGQSEETSAFNEVKSKHQELSKKLGAVEFSKQKIKTYTKKGDVVDFGVEAIAIKELPKELQTLAKRALKKPLANVGFNRVANDAPTNEDLISKVEVEKIANDLIVKQQKTALKDLAENETVKQMHKKRNLSFEAIDVSKIRNADIKHEIHKSTSYNRKQGSQYFLVNIDGRVGYVRISNHWGKFSTNIYKTDPDTKQIDPDYDWEKDPKGRADVFGRVGSRQHNWELVGGKKNGDRYQNISQAGVIWL